MIFLFQNASKALKNEKGQITYDFLLAILMYTAVFSLLISFLLILNEDNSSFLNSSTEQLNLHQCAFIYEQAYINYVTSEDKFYNCPADKVNPLIYSTEPGKISIHPSDHYG